MSRLQTRLLKHETLLVTGGAGFVGSNLAIYFKKRYPALNVLALDNLKRRGSELNVSRLKEAEIKFIHGDIRNREDLELDEKIDVLIDCSAEPSVLAGYGKCPMNLINTNLTGTINCLELTRKSRADIIFLSTSRVYPYDAINSLLTKETETRFEWVERQNKPGWSKNGINVDFSLIGAKSMYGATKLCSEIILQEYIEMYNIRGIINRCGVIAGPWQFGKVDQGVFTLWMLSHYFKRSLKYIGYGGKGKQVRDVLHVEDLFELIDIQLKSLQETSGKVYNVGGGVFNNLSLAETTNLCVEITGNRIQISSNPKNRPADINIYISDNSRVSSEFGWKPKLSNKKILEDVYKWIRNNEDDIFKCLVSQR